MGSQFVQGLDRDADHRLQRLLSEDPPVSGNLFSAADAIDTALVNRCLRETLSATSDQEDYSVISVLGSSRLHLSQITDALMKTHAALALCVTDMVVICVDAKVDAIDLSGFASLIQAKSMLSSMQPGAFTSAFGRDCAFCSPVVLIVYNSPWPSSDAMLDLWQQKLQSCWEATPKSAVVQQAGMRSMFKISVSALPNEEEHRVAFVSQCKWLRFKLTNPFSGGSGYLPAVKTSGSMPAGAYHTFVDTCWKSLHPAEGADPNVLSRTFTGLYQAKQEEDVLKICQERRAAELVRFGSYSQWISLRNKCQTELVPTFKADVEQLVKSFEHDFGQTLSKDVQVSPTALQEEVLQLRAAMLLMIRNEAFQPQMRLCSKTVLNATKTAIASSQGPLVRAHQATLEAKALGDLRMQFRLRRPDSVTSLDPAFLERMASLKVHVKDEIEQADLIAKVKAKMAQRPQRYADPRVQKLQEQFGKMDDTNNEEWSSEHSAGQAEWPVDEMEELGKKQKSKVETTCQDAVAFLKKLPPGWGGDISRLKIWAMGQQKPPPAAAGPRKSTPTAPAPAQGKGKASGPHMIKMVAGLTSLLLMMPKLLAMIQDDKATRSSICKELAKLLGPQVYTVVQSALHRDDFKAFIKQALGPLAHTAIATIAMLALKMIFSYIQGELDWDEFTSVSSMIGVQTLLMCLSIAFPPAAYIPLLLSAASQLVAFCFPKFAEQVRVAIQKVIKFLGTALPLAQTAVGFALVAFGAYTPAMVFCVGYIGAAAGTGTAISTLSGAAATNAAMAWLGGGTVVAGGGGVAAGAAVMATVATGGLLIAAGGIAWLGYSFWEQDNAPSNVSEDLIDEGLIAK